jgi:Zn-dependent M28 family amino/carboxypeptidase
MINFDMIGRNPDQPVRLYLGRMPAGMGSAVREAAGRSEVPMEFDTGRIRAASDHFPFHEAGIPVASFFTGVHDDYHAPSDSAEKLDYHRMEAIVKTAAEIVQAVAQHGPVTVASEAERSTLGETHGR